MIKRRFSQRALAYGLSAVLALSAVLLSLYLPDTLARLGDGALLRQALSDGEPDGLVMPFVENYDGLAPLLAQEIRSDLIDRIVELGEASRQRKERNVRPRALSALTEREFEIVRLMAQRLSNREIAERLFLTEGSVKQYVKQIYSKLHIDGDTRTKRRRLNELLEAKA